MYLLGDPLFEQARQDPRWKVLLARMGLPVASIPPVGS